MKYAPLLVAFVCVVLTAASQLFLKLGTAPLSLPQSDESRTGAQAVITTLLLSPYFWLGMLCFGLSAVLWIFVLSKLPLSAAYPLVALGVVLTTLAARFLLGETISSMRATGIGVIVVGVILVGLSN